jgi:hypothetical protein
MLLNKLKLDPPRAAAVRGRDPNTCGAGFVY